MCRSDAQGEGQCTNLDPVDSLDLGSAQDAQLGSFVLSIKCRSYVLNRIYSIKVNVNTQ